ncbi:MAG: glycosyltransferase family 2 protein [Selenomonadaceae bacterium]|nr:glycosyltransferase family 2 protein [Selenomonadaceae bacterium]
MTMERLPLVSVIIPMYNAERFIEQTLESLCRQTMKDFEVVIVDDCSTDNSLAVVKNFAPRLVGLGIKVNGIGLKKNNGSPGVPRNIAINFARGKYIAFLDADDLFTPTALEELSTLAEKFQADVVNMTDFFCFDDEQLKGVTTEELLKTNHRVITCRKIGAPRLQQATEIPHDIFERVKLWLNNDIHWATCATFCKKDFLSANEIRFPNMKVGEDIILNFVCFCLARKYLRVPNVVYFYRQRGDSASHGKADAEKHFHKFLRNLNLGFKELDKFMRLFQFFTERQDYRYAVFNWFFEKIVRQAEYFLGAYGQAHHAALAQIAEQVFSDDEATFSAYLFNTVNIQRIQIMQLYRELAKFHRQ